MAPKAPLFRLLIASPKPFSSCCSAGARPRLILASAQGTGTIRFPNSHSRSEKSGKSLRNQCCRGHLVMGDRMYTRPLHPMNDGPSSPPVLGSFFRTLREIYHSVLCPEFAGGPTGRIGLNGSSAIRLVST